MIYLKKRCTNSLTANKKSFLFIVFISLIFITPQLITCNMVIGSDAIFHFNRFYDTSEQIRNGNFEYFISLYGFQQSGRIVNAFYGPFVAYLHGLLVLFSKNWFVYQVLSNLILFIISGCSMYTFLRAGHFTYRKSRIGAVLYMCTFSILYWATRQGFSSWGSALMPLCLTVIFYVFEERRVPRFKLGFFTAFLFQTHILSALILVLIYTPIFLYAFIKNTNKLDFVVAILKEILLFIMLTLNIWSTYFIITRENRLVAPFINHTMSSNTINQNSYYWLLNPMSLILMLLIILGIFFSKWKTHSTDLKMLFIIMLSFLLLSTSLIPWNYFIEKNVSIVELIQFPFRFFVPVTILLIYLFLQITDFEKLNNYFVVLGILQVVILMFATLNSWNNDENYILSGPNTIIENNDVDSVKKSFFLKDKSESLKIVEKTTPDYLPIYDNTDLNKYKLYEEKIIYKNEIFEKSVNNSKLIIYMDQSDDKYTELPVIIYTDTILSTNGIEIAKRDYKLSEIGTPIIPNGLIENNQVEIAFDHQLSDFFIVITVILWIVVGLVYLYRARIKI
ncbi:MAG: hypothetical protein WAW98_01435 [Trichococcus flocculiformis]